MWLGHMTSFPTGYKDEPRIHKDLLSPILLKLLPFLPQSWSERIDFDDDSKEVDCKS